MDHGEVNSIGIKLEILLASYGPTFFELWREFNQKDVNNALTMIVFLMVRCFPRLLLRKKLTGLPSFQGTTNPPSYARFFRDNASSNLLLL